MEVQALQFGLRLMEMEDIGAECQIDRKVKSLVGGINLNAGSNPVPQIARSGTGNQYNRQSPGITTNTQSIPGEFF